MVNPAIADEPVVSKIVKGETSKTQVEELIGKPTAVEFTDGGLEKWAYVHADTSYYGLGYAAKRHTLTAVFDDDGTVKHVGKGELDH